MKPWTFWEDYRGGTIFLATFAKVEFYEWRWKGRAVRHRRLCRVKEIADKIREVEKIGVYNDHQNGVK